MDLLSLIIEMFQGIGYDKSKEIGGCAMVTSEVTTKLESLSKEDYNMIVSLIDRLAEKPSNVLRNARNKYVRENPMSMEEINTEIERYRSES